MGITQFNRIITFPKYLHPFITVINRKKQSISGKKMSKEDFRKLSLHKKINKLYTEGTFVVGIRYYAYKINLYLLGREYVEVFYNHKHDRIDKIDFLNPSHSRMKFYLDQISLEDF